MNKEIPKVTEWFNSNKLRIDTNKTVAMLFHIRQRTLAIDECLIKINDDTIPFSTHTKFLGVNIDNNLAWKPHISHIVTKISDGVGILLHLSKELPKNILTLIYKTLILPYSTCCCITWGFTYHTYINKIFNIQKSNENNYSFPNLLSFITTLSNNSNFLTFIKLSSSKPHSLCLTF